MKAFEHRRERELPRLEEESLAATERALTLVAGPVRVAQVGRTMVCSLPTGVQVALRPQGEGHRLTVSEPYEWYGWLLGVAASLVIGAGVAYLFEAFFFAFALLFLSICVAGGTLLGHLPRRRRVAKVTARIESALRIRVAEAERLEHEQAVPVRERVVDE